jgi:hypothetical protein
MKPTSARRRVKAKARTSARNRKSSHWSSATGAADEVTYTLEISHEAQEQLILALLASPPVEPPSKPRRFFQPIGVRVFQSNTGGAGMSLFLTKEIAIHMSLLPPMVEAVERQLASFRSKKKRKH